MLCFETVNRRRINLTGEESLFLPVNYGLLQMTAAEPLALNLWHYLYVTEVFVESQYFRRTKVRTGNLLFGKPGTRSDSELSENHCAPP